MHKINIKPLSVNKAWKGRRYKTAEYKAYEQELLYVLPKKIDLPEPPYFIYYEFGFSSSASDADNPVKPFQDILQKKYGFNDNRIVDSRQRKFKVNKGDEYIKFNIYNIDDPTFLIYEIEAALSLGRIEITSKDIKTKTGLFRNYKIYRIEK